MSALVWISVGLACVGMALVLLIGAGRLVARIGGPRDDQIADPASAKRSPSMREGTFSLVVTGCAAVVGLVAGRALADMASHDIFQRLFEILFLVMFLGGVFIALIVIGLAATKVRHGQITWAIGSVFVAAALIAVGTLVGRATAPATGVTYHEPVVLVAPATVRIHLDAGGPSFTARDGGTAECHSVPDQRTFSDLSALDLGELGPGTLRGAFTIWAGESGSGSIELFIDGGDLPEGSLMVSWAGSARVTATSAAGDSGALSFDALVLSTGDGKPVPADLGQEAASPAPSTFPWPPTLSGTLDWTCGPWLGSPDGGAIPPPSLAPRASQQELPSSAPDDTPPPEPTEFAAPSPKCPAPLGAIHAPDVVATVGAGPGVVTTTGSSTLMTCSTTAAADGLPGDRIVEVVANAGDQLTLTLPAGWGYLRWEGSDRPAVGEGANVWLPVDVSGAPNHIDVPIPGRTGASVANYSLWVVGFDGRVVGQLEISVAISVR